MRFFKVIAGATLACALGTTLAASPALAAEAGHVKAAKPASPLNAAVSGRIKLDNYTTASMKRFSYHLDHGAWSDGWFPPEAIAADARATWASESDGFLTGTEGTVTWRMYKNGVAVGNVKTHWDVPFSGDNSAWCTAPAGYKCLVSISDNSNHPWFTYALNRQH
jgi:hypothetical protein